MLQLISNQLATFVFSMPFPNAEKFLQTLPVLFGFLIGLTDASGIFLIDRLSNELITPDAVWHLPRITGVEPGSEGQKKFAREAIANNPDFRIQVEEFLSDGIRFSSAARCI